MPFVGETPHQLPVAHVMKLLPVLLGLTALLKMFNSLKHTQAHPDTVTHV